MIRSRITVRDNLGHLTKQLEELAQKALNNAAEAAAAVARSTETRVDLEIEVIPAHASVNGATSGINSRKRGSKSHVRLAPIYDGGSLGKRKRKLAKGSHRKPTWTVSHDGNEHEAHRHEITADMGIAPSNAFAKAKRAGQTAIKETLSKP